MPRFNRLTFAILPLLLSGCIATTFIKEEPPNIELVTFPEIGVVSAVQVGESLIFTGRQQLFETLRLDKEYIQQTSSDEAFVLPNRGFYYLTHSDKTGKLFHSPNIIWRDINPDGSCQIEDGICEESVDEDNGNDEINRVGVHVNDSTGRVDWVFVQERKKRVRSFPRTDIEFKRTGKIADPFIPPKFKRELIYSGMSGTSITITYREFMNDMARPAFTQELKYDLANSDIVGYKSARFQVLEASNTFIKYKILNPLD